MVELESPIVLVVMGVSGSGKSTIAAALAERLGWPFEEGDSLHPAANVAKMTAGVPLTDDDRWPWLAKVADWIDGRLDTGENGVVTCSALKRSYRAVLNRRGQGVEFVYLALDRSELQERLDHRTGHFMPRSLLDSQLDTLEAPGATEPAITVDAGSDPQLTVDRILRQLGLHAKPTGPSGPAAPAAAAPASPRARRPGSPRRNRSRS
jgi:carbohydrate kinase (thermoresistant glucokinase family)